MDMGDEFGKGGKVWRLSHIVIAWLQMEDDGIIWC